MFAYVIPYGILLFCNIRIWIQLRQVIQNDRKEFQKIQIGKTLCKLKKEIITNSRIEMEEIKVENEVSIENQDRTEDIIAVSSQIMTPKSTVSKKQSAEM